MRAAVVQLNSNADRARNTELAEAGIRAAAGDGAELIVLPEKWNLLASGEEMAAGAERLDGPSINAARGWARELGCALVAGSVTERADDGGKPYNTSVAISPSGDVEAVYRKIHLFDVDVADVAYRESDHERHGEDLAAASLAGLELGMTVCYDLRFPELYRILALGGADAISIPSAFTATTGRAHWSVLLRARAIENAVFVLAANQFGRAAPQHDSHGHSAIVGPWGDVLAEVGDGATHVCADLDLAELARVRESLPALANRVPAAYRWPAEVGA